MEFHNVFSINQTPLDFSQSYGVKIIVEKLSHANQNYFTNPTLRKQIENNIQTLFVQILKYHK